MVDIKVGDSAEFSKTISEFDVYSFAGVTGDLNPAHINEEYAKDTFFKKRIAHGMLLGGFISAVIALKLPGPGTIYLSQSLEFKAPVYFGDTITAKVTVLEIQNDRKKVHLDTRCINQQGKTVVEGNAMVSPPRRRK